MYNKIYKLSFKTPVHFGTGRLSSSQNTIFSDTLFSAFCIEGLKLFGENGAENIYNLIKEEKLSISDTMPYYKDTFFIPKPIIEIVSENKGDSSLKKKYKNLKYIPLTDLDDFLNGSYDPTDALNILETKIGKSSENTKVYVKNTDDNEPYNIGTYSFHKDSGLYFIASCKNEETLNILESLVNSLSFSGIGGKISSGFGKFNYTSIDMPESIEINPNKAYDYYLSLSLSMAKDDELDAVLSNGTYELIKRSGFVANNNSFETPVRKRDFYAFKAGSAFNVKFKGDVYNVSPFGENNVYKYCIPMFIGLDVRRWLYGI